jgi:hypothetical protein
VIGRFADIPNNNKKSRTYEVNGNYFTNDDDNTNNNDEEPDVDVEFEFERK